MIRQWRFPSAIVLAMVLASQLSARAATVTYTFESPIFALGESTPSLTNRAPNIGSSSFRARFDSVGGMFAIGNDPNLPNGMSLVESGSNSSGGLIIFLNTSVNSVTLDFALSRPGSLSFHGPTGNITASTGTSMVGVLTFSSPTPFSGFSLFSPDAVPWPKFSIDNLVMNVPEPSALALLAAGGFVVLVRKICRRDLATSKIDH